MASIVELTCPGCGARVDEQVKECPFCHQPLVYSNLRSVGLVESTILDKTIKNYLLSNSLNSEKEISLGLCYLKLKLYDKAINTFEFILNKDISNSDVYYFLSIALLRGKKAFMCDRNSINRIIDYLNAALSINEKGDYYFFLAYIKYDYFYRKSLRSEPDFIAYKTKADEFRFSNEEKDIFFSTLNVLKPSVF